jgi:hypothetical protein
MGLPLPHDQLNLGLPKPHEEEEEEEEEQEDDEEEEDDCGVGIRNPRCLNVSRTVVHRTL